MRKITAVFDSIGKIQKFKRIMRKVYSDRNDNIPEISKFNLNKSFIPDQVDKVELEIKKLIGSNITLNIPKTSLTFLAGQEHPYTSVAANLEDEAKYIVLPWNIGSVAGLENLKNLIDQIPATTKTIKYTVHINNDTASHINEEAISKSDVGSFVELSTSRSRISDNTELLFTEIETINGKLHDSERKLGAANLTIENQKAIIAEGQAANTTLTSKVSALTMQNNNLQSQITGLNSQILSLNGQISNLNSQIVTLSKNEVGWDTSIANRTTLSFVGFTGQVVADIDPANGTFRVNLI